MYNHNINIIWVQFKRNHNLILSWRYRSIIRSMYNIVLFMVNLWFLHKRRRGVIHYVGIHLLLHRFSSLIIDEKPRVDLFQHVSQYILHTRVAVSHFIIFYGIWADCGCIVLYYTYIKNKNIREKTNTVTSHYSPYTI